MNVLDYELPAHLIAQHPTAIRDASRLLYLPPEPARRHHRWFRDLPDILRPGDLLVLNDTKVLPARLFGHREGTGGKWESLFIGESAGGMWELLSQTRGKLQPGEFVRIEPGPLRLELCGRSPEGHWLARPDAPGSPAELLMKHGHMPLPPYIRKGLAEAGDTERYQTVYAARLGAVAAPTAGLHFTADLFDRLQQRGIARSYLTLHVGIGTFHPIREADFRRHVMHSECAELPAATAAAIQECRARGGRIIAVGTTTVRVLETVAATGSIRPWSGETNLFIFPPHEFRAVDALITNFHLPHSTLLLLAAAFAGPERLRAAYDEAIAKEYRFYSYGDAMLIEREPAKKR